jgi:hypothetical protein
MREHLARLRAFLLTRRPEALIVLFGILLRVSLNVTYDVHAGYDFPFHYDYVKYIVDHGQLPPYNMGVETYHPPLFYWIAAAMVRAGCELQSLGWISILAGCLRLIIVWIGLELYLPGQRFARLVALSLLAVFPADLHLDGMASNEGVSTLFTAASAVLLPLALRAEGSPRRRHLWGAALGLALGLSLLCKVSATVIVFVAVVGGALTVWRAFRSGTRAMRPLVQRIAPLLTAAVVTASVAGWFFVRNYALYGMAAPTGYDGFARPVVAEFLAKPFLDRRTIGYVAGFDTAIYDDPYYPTSSIPIPRFNSGLIATTFSDYYDNGFGAPLPGEPSWARNHRLVHQTSYALSRYSVVGGTALVLAVLAAGLALARHLWRRGDDARLVLLLIPLLTVLGQLTFAIQYPNDTYGPIKGVYMQFGMPPAFALVGVAAAWAWSRRRTRLLAVAVLAGQLAVTAYSLQCRLPHLPHLLALRLSAPTPPAPPKH